MYYSEEVIENVRSSNDIVDVISAYVKLQKKGSSWFGLCPFHNEKTPSFSVSGTRQMYYCFGCGEGGNVLTFLMKYENYSFQEALQVLADRAGIRLPEQEQSPQQKREQDLRQSILQVNKMAASYYYYLLRSDAGKTGMAYLKGRALTDETMHNFGLGYAGRGGTNLIRYLRSKGISDELIREAGLAGTDEKRGMYDKFWNRVIFPIMDANSRVIGFGGRVMGDGKPKYLNSPETKIFDKSRNLYGLNFAKRTKEKYLIVCEGYMDVIAMHQAGFTNAVASLGTALTSRHAALLRRYTEEVILSYDSDEAGVKAAMRAIPLMREAGVRAKVLDLSPYKDPDEFIKAEGADSFRTRLENARGSFDFTLTVMEKQYDLKNPESRTEFLKQVSRKIADFDTEVERESYMQAVSERYNTSMDGLRQMVLRYLVQSPASLRDDYDGEEPVRRPAAKRKKSDEGLVSAQSMILTWMSEYPGFFKSASRFLTPLDFTDPFCRKAAGLLYAQYESGSVNPARLVDCFTDPEEQSRAATLFQAPVPSGSEGELKGAMREAVRRVLEASLAGQEEDGVIVDLASLQQSIERRRLLDDLDKMEIDLGLGEGV